MRNRVESRDPAFAGSFGASVEAATPARVQRDAAAPVATSARAARTRLGRALRIVRDAAIVVAVMALIPIALVQTRGESVWGNGDRGANVRARVARAEAMRPFMVSKDPSITPMQAGLALAAVQRPPRETEFAMRKPESLPQWSWRDEAMTPSMFVSAQTKLYNGPSSQAILRTVAAGFSPAETKFLRTLATAPIWREFEVIARAPAVDIIGGRFTLPFSTGVSMGDMPQVDMASLRELSNAAVARAAYHLSLGQKDSAEAVLRSIVSLGFALIDNGTSFSDEFAGNVIVGLGRDALQRYYTIVGDARATSPALRPGPSIASPPRDGASLPRDAVRASLLARVADPTIHRGERYELLRSLAQSSCTNLSELMLGPKSDVTNALAKARTDLARFPSEQALVDLAGSTPRPKVDIMRHGPLDMFVVSAGTVAGTVLRNPRLPACARITTAYQYFN